MAGKIVDSPLAFDGLALKLTWVCCSFISVPTVFLAWILCFLGYMYFLFDYLYKGNLRTFDYSFLV